MLKNTGSRSLRDRIRRARSAKATIGAAAAHCKGPAGECRTFKVSGGVKQTDVMRRINTRAAARIRTPNRKGHATQTQVKFLIDVMGSSRVDAISKTYEEAEVAIHEWTRKYKLTSTTPTHKQAHFMIKRMGMTPEEALRHSKASAGRLIREFISKQRETRQEAKRDD